MEPLVSVIVPAHNAAPWLERCLRSLTGQTLEELEIILVDDGSTDATPTIADAWAARWPGRVRLLRLERSRGSGAARNAGLDAAAARYVGFADADDTQEPEMFARLLAAAEAAHADVTVCGLREVSARGKADEVHIPPDTITPEALLANRKLMPRVWNKLFSRAFLQRRDIRFPETSVAEDAAFNFKALACDPRLASVPETLYNYHRQEGSTTLEMTMRAESIASLADAREWLVRRGLLARYRKVWRKRAWLTLVYYPGCLLLIDALIKGRHRWKTVRATPGYLLALARFLLRRKI